jgi:cell division protein ZipA
MPELRWTLLVLGVLFIAALAWWELRRPRQAHRSDRDRFAPAPKDLTKEPSREPPPSPVDAPRMHREPTFNVPEMRSREPVHELPVIEISDDSLIGLRIDGHRVEEEVRQPEVIAEEPVLPTEREPEPEPTREPVWEAGLHEATWEAPPGEAEPLSPAEEAEVIDQEFAEERPGITPAAAPMFEARTAPIDLPPVSEPVVAWPDEAERRIMALRLVSAADRFPGRALRQALAGEGFILGKFSIFHKAGPDGRAIVSAASLTRPGTFDLDTMDTQRYGGLNLFAVLPGPLPPMETFEALLSTARALNERLEGGLQDDKGQPLTPARLQAVRESLLLESMQPGEGEPTS